MRCHRLLIVAFCQLVGAAHAEPVRLDSVKLLQHGLYHAERDDAKAELHTAQGFFSSKKAGEFLRDTQRVPACLGTTFGHKFRVIGTPAGAPVSVRTSTIPPHPMRDPAVDQPIAKAVKTFDIPIGAENVHTYTLEYPWEVIRGTWTFQVWYGDRLMLEDKFDVTGDCAGVSLLMPPNPPRDLNEPPVQG